MGATISFGQWLKQHRNDLDLTQEEVARRIGCSDIAIRKMESGVRRPSRQLAGLLAVLFNVPAEEREKFVKFARGVDSGTEPQQPTSGAASWTASPQPSIGNLRSRLTPLIGREELAAEIGSRLLQDEVRLVTLTGPPGIGKTRLALQVASDLTGKFEDGVFFVPLAPISDPGLVVPAIAQALGVRETGRASIAESLAQHLHSGQALLVLDNFEQVVEAARGVVSILETSSHVKVVVTSREPLHVRGERIFGVPPLKLPDPGHIHTAEALLGTPAVALFVERARALEPGFVLTEQNGESVAAICVHLEGLPLAIELAAARTSILTPQEIQARLQDKGRDRRLKLLSGGPRDVPARQQTLRRAIDWSYGLLSQGEQTLLARLGVFVGGFSLPAAEAVCNAHGDLPVDVLDGAESLLDKSLLKREEVLGESRYTMLEMIHEYALEQLEQSGEADSIRRLHAEYYLALAETAEVGLSGPEQPGFLERLTREHDNLRATLDWALECREAERALRFAGLLSSFWLACGYFTEGRGWLRKALELVEPGNANSQPFERHEARSSPYRASALYGYGLLALQQSDYAAAQANLEQSRVLYRKLDDKEGQSNALNSLAFLTAFSDYERAVELNRENLALCRQIGDKGKIARALQNLGYIMMYQGKWSEASSLTGEAYSLARESGSPILPQTLHTLAMIASGQGDYPLAQARFEECLEIAREMRNDLLTAWTLHDLGDLLYHREDYGGTRAMLTQAMQMFAALGAKLGIAHTLVSLGREAYRVGDYGEAIHLYKEAVALGRMLDNPVVLGCCLAGFAAIAAQRGELQVAALLFGVAHDALESASTNLERYAMTLNMDEVHAAVSTSAPGAWEAAWSEAHAMTIEGALAYADA